MAAINDTRQTQMTVDLGGEQVMLQRLVSIEPLALPFEMTVDIIASLGEIDLLPHLGKPIGVHIYEDDQLMRHFHGLISSAEFRQDSAAGFHYRLTARPFTYFLANNRNMAIFQDLSVPEIISKVFEDAGQSGFQFKLSKTYPKRDYCVQYRESDFDFVTRLMEEEGIYYFFQHAANQHIMILCDSASAHETANPGTLHYNPSASSAHSMGSSQRGGTQYYLESLAERVESHGEQHVTLRDFDFTKPERPLQAESTAAKQHPTDAQEVYDYPGNFHDEGRGAALGAVRLAALRRKRQVYRGASQAVGLATGTKVTVVDHPTGRFNRAYIIGGTKHSVSNEQYYAGQNLTDEEGTYVTFDAIPADTAFHLPRSTARPVVQGLETAIVSGPSGEEIFTDEYGRVKVRFHWDRASTTGERSTCWIRVAQFGGLGNVILPRIGQEVMIDFLHGNPDEPIVMGWVFNKSQMPVYPLPDNKTRALWRTKSYPGGRSITYPETTALDTGSPGANELRFEDKSGSEEVFIHAEKDMNLRTRNDQTNHVGHNQYEKVYWDRDSYIERHENSVLNKGDQTLEIKEGKQTETINGNREVTIKTGNDTLTVKMGNLTTDVKMGNISVKAGLGKIDVEAMQSITLKVGGSSIVIDQVGVTIKGMVKVETHGVMVQSTADAMHTIKGGLVMIN